MVGCAERAARNSGEGSQRVAVTAVGRHAVVDDRGPRERTRGQWLPRAVDRTAAEVDGVTDLPRKGGGRGGDRRRRRRPRIHNHARGVGAPDRVGDPEPHRRGPRGERLAGRGRCRIGERAAAEIPRVGESLARGGSSVERDVERRSTGGRAGRRDDAGHGRGLGPRGVPDAVDRATPGDAAREADVEEVATGGFHDEVDRFLGRALEQGGLRLVGQAAGTGGEIPDALTRVVGEEQRALVRDGIVRPGGGREGESTHR